MSLLIQSQAWVKLAEIISDLSFGSSMWICIFSAYENGTGGFHKKSVLNWKNHCYRSLNCFVWTVKGTQLFVFVLGKKMWGLVSPLGSPGPQAGLHTYTTWSYSSKTSKGSDTATQWPKAITIQHQGNSKLSEKPTILVKDSWKRFLQVMLDERLFTPSLSHF